jgi:hypothetical protein
VYTFCATTPNQDPDSVQASLCRQIPFSQRAPPNAIKRIGFREAIPESRRRFWTVAVRIYFRQDDMETDSLGWTETSKRTFRAVEGQLRISANATKGNARKIDVFV